MGDNDITVTPKTRVLLSVPLDAALLQSYRQMEETPSSDSEEGVLQVPKGNAHHTKPWMAYYSHEDPLLGINWHLYVRDLSKLSERKRWRVV